MQTDCEIFTKTSQSFTLGTFLDYFILQPFSLQKSPDKEDRPEDPVDHHGCPHTDGAPAKSDTKDHAEKNAEYNHREYGNKHAKLYISGRAQRIWHRKGSRPQEDCHTIMDHNQNIRIPVRFRRERKQFQNKRQAQ